MYIVYVKTQLQKLRKIGVNRTYCVLKIFVYACNYSGAEKTLTAFPGAVNGVIAPILTPLSNAIYVNGEYYGNFIDVYCYRLDR